MHLYTLEKNHYVSFSHEKVRDYNIIIVANVSFLPDICHSVTQCHTVSHICVKTKHQFLQCTVIIIPYIIIPYIFIACQVSSVI